MAGSASEVAPRVDPTRLKAFSEMATASQLRTLTRGACPSCSDLLADPPSPVWPAILFSPPPPSTLLYTRHLFQFPPACYLQPTNPPRLCRNARADITHTRKGHRDPRSLPLMDRFDRVYRLHSILAGRKTPISFNDLMDRLECSKAMVLRMNARCLLAYTGLIVGGLVARFTVPHKRLQLPTA